MSRPLPSVFSLPTERGRIAFRKARRLHGVGCTALLPMPPRQALGRACVSTSPVDVAHRHPLSSPPKPFDGAVSALSEAPDDPCYQQHTARSMYLMWHIPWGRCKKLLWRARV